MMEQIVKCKWLDSRLKQRYTRGEVNLTLSKAKRLQHKGKLEILDKEVDNAVKTVNTYKTKVMMASNNSYLTRTSFSLKKNLKIGWIQDYSKEGGAELSNKHLVSIGEGCGFDIVGITPSNISRGILYKADLLIINNFFEFSVQSFDAVLNAIYERRIPYIKYDHDQREMKRVDVSRQLFSQSVLNVFISPLHLEKISQAVGSQIEKHSICLPLSINTKLFKKMKDVTRVKNSVLVPTFRKCGESVLKYVNKNKDKRYYILDKCDARFNAGTKVEIIKKVSNDEMPLLYNKYENMLHLPRLFWAGERIYFEALLCGCKPIVNDNVGHSSWKFTNRELKKKLIKAPYKFWKEVEKCLIK